MKSLIMCEKSPIMCEKSPIMCEKSPIMCEKSPIMCEKSPIICEKSPTFVTTCASRRGHPHRWRKGPVSDKKSPLEKASLLWLHSPLPVGTHIVLKMKPYIRLHRPCIVWKEPYICPCNCFSPWVPTYMTENSCIWLNGPSICCEYIYKYIYVYMYIYI